MKDKIFTKDEAYALVKHEQKSLLDLRGIKYKSNASESTLVDLIVSSNPSQSYKPPLPESKLVLELYGDDIHNFKKVLEIAKAGFPDTDLITFINGIESRFK